jgi:hypothetical protein
MSPDQRSDRAQTTYTACVSCDGPLADGDDYTCRKCVEAAHIACREITGRAILPSDVAAIRARLG